MLLGGLTAADTSRADIRIATPKGDTGAGQLPTGLHDTAAVRIGNAVYVFGGGTAANTQSDAIVRVPMAGGAGTQVAQLPAPSSDQSAAAMGGTAYVVGYTGSRWLDKGPTALVDYRKDVRQLADDDDSRYGVSRV